MQVPYMVVPRLEQGAPGGAFSGAAWQFVAGLGPVEGRWTGGSADPFSSSDVTDQSFQLTFKFVGVKLQDFSIGGLQELFSTLSFAPFGGLSLSLDGNAFGDAIFAGLALSPLFVYSAQNALDPLLDVPILSPFVVHLTYAASGFSLYFNGRLIGRLYPETRLGDYSTGAPLSISSGVNTYIHGFAAASVRVGVALSREQVADDFVSTVPSSPHLTSSSHTYSVQGALAPNDTLLDGVGSYNLIYDDNAVFGDPGPFFGFAPALDAFQVLLRDITQASSTQLDHTVLSTGDGTYWWVMTQVVGTPTVAQIKSGRDASGGLAPASGNAALLASTASATQSATGLTTGEGYYLYGYAEASDARTVGPVFLDAKTAGVGALGSFDNSFDQNFLKA